MHGNSGLVLIGKGVLFRDASSVERCPYREVQLYTNLCQE